MPTLVEGYLWQHIRKRIAKLEVLDRLRITPYQTRNTLPCRGMYEALCIITWRKDWNLMSMKPVDERPFYLVVESRFLGKYSICEYELGEMKTSQSFGRDRLSTTTRTIINQGLTSGPSHFPRHPLSSLLPNLHLLTPNPWRFKPLNPP